MNKVNEKVIELVNKIKERGDSGSLPKSQLIDTLKKYGIDCAFCTNMSIDELTKFIEDINNPMYKEIENYMMN
jgi:aerobic-type carbon monoxide dehydrogenase small subunit (CoxS/CutS family)